MFYEKLVCFRDVLGMFYVKHTPKVCFTYPSVTEVNIKVTYKQPAWRQSDTSCIWYMPVDENNEVPMTGCLHRQVIA